ncbi:MAG: 2-oxoacid:acceptor oxidoreductase family protein [Candidatus Sericytochromatia bacterium]|nr:2-oxoacid:acceptor oxidoreductase family protein [Candidatus Tanganyikabacteria bacterium]
MKLAARPQSAPAAAPPRFPGVPAFTDGCGAVVAVETAASEGAGAYPITPSTPMGEGWAQAVAAGKRNAFGRPLAFFEPEGEHAAAAVTAGMSMTGMRAANFSSGQGIAYMHESLYAAAGKRLTYVLSVAARAMTKHALNVHAGHDDYHAVDDTGFFQLFAKNPQEAADLTVIAHRIAELALNPGLVAQDGFLTSHVVESVRLPEPALVRAYLGDPADLIDAPTPAQRMVYGEKRRRVPAVFDVDFPAALGPVQNQDAYQQGVAAQRPFFFNHVREFADQAFEEYAGLTGRHYARVEAYRADDAEIVLVAQGSVVSDAQAVADHLRATRKLKVGVLGLTMFRPFPADLLTRHLAGKKAAIVLERVDQPLAVDPPLLREIRAAASKALENALAAGQSLPYPDLAKIPADRQPRFFSGCFGLGSRDLQPGDLVAAVENALPGGAGRRHFYLGVEFVRQGTRLPKLQIWQEQLLAGYPHLADLALPPGANLDLLPAGSLAVRIHSVGGWGAITMGKNLGVTTAELLGRHLKAMPKYGSEKKGQPTLFHFIVAPEPVRLNCEVRHVGAVLSPDPNVFMHGDPLAGLAEGGAFVVQSNLPPGELWAAIPAWARQIILDRKVRVFALDAFRIATEEVSDPGLRYRLQAAAFMGAFFATGVDPEIAALGEEKVLAGIREQIARKFGAQGDRVVEDNMRAIRRGYEEVVPIECAPLDMAGAADAAVPGIPPELDRRKASAGFANPGRFWEQVGHPWKLGQDGIADPFAALSFIPAATSTIRDLTFIRFEVPQFVADKCTGCGQCWTQCPDSAIPGVVTSPQDLLGAAIKTLAQDGRSFDRLKAVVRPVAAAARGLLAEKWPLPVGELFAEAYKQTTAKLEFDAEKQAALDAEFAPVREAIARFPVARTAPFFDVPEANEKGSGGLLSITVNPEACKGCNLCVDVCHDGALITVPQDDRMDASLRANWRLWRNLPETPDRFVNVSNLAEGIGVLPTLLLKQRIYGSLCPGDGACMGCGEKTGVHLVLSAVNALLLPRVEKYVARLRDLSARLDEMARKHLAAGADLAAIARGAEAAPGTTPADAGAARRIARIKADVDDLVWRYEAGPGGRGRANAGIANATGCSSVWGSTWPLNPYPIPWVNHLFQDAPSLAIGLFEGQMRKMAAGFAAVRRAELEVAGQYDPAEHDPELATLGWQSFTPEEFDLCPPIFAVGGDGAMLDIGFQNLSRLLASGKPIRVLILDTQVYSNTGGQACTSGFTGQVSDMAGYGAAQRGKEEVRKEAALLAMAHRDVFVLQSSQASPAHLIGGTLRALQARRPSVVILHSPCPPEHGIGDEAAERAARLALESRAFPLLCYDPAAGPALADRLNLDGNPQVGELWPTYELAYLADDGSGQRMELPLTTADWAATEGRFRQHFAPLSAEADAVPFHEYLELPADDREGKTPFIYLLGAGRKLDRLAVAAEIVRLAEDRRDCWRLLEEMAGLRLAPSVEQAARAALASEWQAKVDALRAEYEARLAEFRREYPAKVARRLAEGLVRAGDLDPSVAAMLSRVGSLADLEPVAGWGEPAPGGNGGGPARESAPPRVAAATVEAPPAPSAPAAAPEAASAPAPAADAGIGLDPYIETERCTSCDECTRLNKRMFAYDAQKQAYIKDATAGTFRDLVMAAEKCPVRIIHPGTPLNPGEKDLAKWVKRAEPFN